jgi:hypothetical protein
VGEDDRRPVTGNLEEDAASRAVDETVPGRGVAEGHERRDRGERARRRRGALGQMGRRRARRAGSQGGADAYWMVFRAPVATQPVPPSAQMTR